MKTGNKKFLFICLFLTGLLTGISLKYTKISYAHLCDDVFLQAKDNLAVKVDIRDGQLRVADKGEFRVYVLNTMDRAIWNIKLEVNTSHFDVDVNPAKNWSNYPYLDKNDKQFFQVTLKRKEDVEKGKYKIGLKLVNGQDDSMVFKSLKINDAMDIVTIPGKKDEILIDGNITRKEWEKSCLCTSFYEYIETTATLQSLKSHLINHFSEVQTRVRFAYGKEYLYCMIDFGKTGGKSIVTLYFARDYESKAKKIFVDLQRKKMTSNIKNFKALIKFNGKKAEMKIPLKSIALNNKLFYLNLMRNQGWKNSMVFNKSFYVNLTRNYAGGKVTYWRGNKINVDDPLVYGKFILK